MTLIISVLTVGRLILPVLVMSIDDSSMSLNPNYLRLTYTIYQLANLELKIFTILFKLWPVRICMNFVTLLRYKTS